MQPIDWKKSRKERSMAKRIDPAGYVVKCNEIIKSLTIRALSELGEECVNRVRDRSGDERKGKKENGSFHIHSVSCLFYMVLFYTHAKIKA